MESLTLILLIVVVMVGTGGLMALLVSRPGPDPRLAAEPLSSIALWFGYYGLLVALGQALPREVMLPAWVAITVVALVAVRWWRRRHPSSPPVEVEPAAIAPQPVEAVIPAAEWVRALVPVLAAGAVLLVVIGLVSSRALSPA